MSEKFHVILADLTAASQSFHSEADVLNNVTSGSAAPAAVDGGSAAFNASLFAVLKEIVFLNSSLAAYMHMHGDNLRKVRDNYQQVDQSMHELFDDLMPES